MHTCIKEHRFPTRLFAGPLAAPWATRHHDQVRVRVKVRVRNRVKVSGG